jgi:hypothetical protein
MIVILLALPGLILVAASSLADALDRQQWATLTREFLANE